MLKPTALMITALTALTACDASTGMPFNVHGPDVIVLKDTLEETVAQDVVQDDLVLDPQFARSIFKGWKNAEQFKLGYSGSSTSGETSAFVGGTTHTGPSGILLNWGGTAFVRNVATTLPDTGEVTYTGEYAGIMRPSYKDPFEAYTTGKRVQGDASLTANFSTSKISGEITNRVVLPKWENRTVVQTFEDIALEEASISKTGAYRGTATGGILLSNDPTNDYEGTTFDGEYKGYIGGENGTETVGSISLRHSNKYAEYIEYGVFIAE